MPDTLLETLNRRDLDIQRLATTLLNDYGYSSLDEAYKSARVILLNAGDITSTTKRNKVLTEINKSIPGITESALAEITAGLTSMALLEANFQAETLTEFSETKVSKPANKLVREYVEKGVMSLESGSIAIAGTWGEISGDYQDAVTDVIKNQVKAGVVNGETTAAIIRRVKLATTGTLRNRISTLVRTGAQHAATQARLAMRDDNLDVIAREIPIVTFDSRTSGICISISEKYPNGWPAGKSPVGYPAYHPNCRTSISFLPEGVELEGERPAIYGKKGEKAEEAFERKEDYAEARGSTVVRYTGRRDKAFEAKQIPVKTPYSRFLAQQPRWYVEQVLGKTKADAFLSGELDLKDLTINGLKPATLDELGV